jgi:hypothetical protein
MIIFLLEELSIWKEHVTRENKRPLGEFREAIEIEN